MSDANRAAERRSLLINVKCIIRRMPAQADDVVDFRLVSTYIPLVLLVLRGVLLLGAAQLVADFLDVRGALVVALVIVVYFDALAFSGCRLNRACGFLGPVALCLLQARTMPVDTRYCDTGYAQALVYGVDMAWAISATSYVAIACYKNYFVVPVTYAAAAWASCAMLHTFTTCEILDVQHQLIRTILYYLTCTLYFYHRHAPALERQNHQLSVLHIFYHIFFVQRFVLLGSIIIAGIVFGALYYSDNIRSPACEAKPWAGPSVSAGTCVDEAAATNTGVAVASKRTWARPPTADTQDDDLMMLRAAQKLNEQP